MLHIIARNVPSDLFIIKVFFYKGETPLTPPFIIKIFANYFFFYKGETPLTPPFIIKIFANYFLLILIMGKGNIGNQLFS
jgi:hypothetical protein